jgi:chaperonin cofactor prefoldin
MTIQIDVKNPEKLKKGDLLVYNGKTFDAISQDEVIKDLLKDMSDLKKEMSVLQSQFKSAKEKLKNTQIGFLKAFVKEV